MENIIWCYLFFRLFIFSVNKFPNPSIHDLDIDKVVPVDADLRTVSGKNIYVRNICHFEIVLSDSVVLNNSIQCMCKEIIVILRFF